ncbi:glutamine--fructose-6-phosphate transaminase (isomerizing) [Treponema sp.]|uniref:glutamine--fructose-6-phosphate transaminase (isomerizing) n=1 Tax=Treponema sp. TaxID=166 RepID=UPI003F07693F
MCGIVGYIGNKNATPVLVNALKKLEYRGYDSAGIAVFTGQDILVRKVKGALKILEEKIADETIEGSLGIGHTRWATHGEPSDINAHPHLNENGTIAVVHNGIIENYIKLKNWLQGEGIVFKSETDSEVVAHLVNYYYNESLDIFEAVKSAVNRLEGSYALGVICKDFPDRIVAARKECPLIVGLGENENFIASDVPAVLEHTRNVCFLEQNEIAVLYKDHVDLFDENGSRIIRQPFHVDWDISSAEKGGYEHFMLKEIHEQPKVLTDTMRPRLVYEDGVPADIKFDEICFDKNWKDAKRIVIVACGTAYYAGMVAKYAFEQLARIPVSVDVASEFRYRNPILCKDDVFIVISQSGETADTLAAMRLAKQRGVRVTAITNCVGSTVSREADDVIYTWAGPEIAVASTKAYTAQLMCLFLLALKTAAVKETISVSDYRHFLSELNSVPEKLQQILEDKVSIQRFVSKNYNKQKVFFVGRQHDSATSLECALKLKEVSYMHSEAFAAGELKHGPIALIDTDTLVVAIATAPELYEKLASNIIEVKSRGAATFVITQDKSDAFKSAADEIVRIPSTEDFFEPMLSIVPAQLFAYYCAVHRGNNPDKPRNLAKSVTVE